jgi:hypothetical protein
VFDKVFYIQIFLGDPEAAEDENYQNNYYHKSPGLFQVLYVCLFHQKFKSYSFQILFALVFSQRK